MFNREEIQMLASFVTINDNFDDDILIIDSKIPGNMWILVDWTELFEERFGLCLKKKGQDSYIPYRECRSLQEVLRRISDYEARELKSEVKVEVKPEVKSEDRPVRNGAPRQSSEGRNQMRNSNHHNNNSRPSNNRSFGSGRRNITTSTNNRINNFTKKS